MFWILMGMALAIFGYLLGGVLIAAVERVGRNKIRKEHAIWQQRHLVPQYRNAPPITKENKMKKIYKNPAAYRKVIVALLGAIITAVALGLLPAAVGDWTAVITSFLTALGVYKVYNSEERID